MCELCKKIYSCENEIHETIEKERDPYDIVEDFNALYKDNEQINMFVYLSAEFMMVENIKYCPYCGKRVSTIKNFM